MSGTPFSRRTFSAMEVDGTNKIVFIPEASSCVFHPLDLGIERFTTGIRNLMSQVGDDCRIVVSTSPLSAHRL